LSTLALEGSSGSARPRASVAFRFVDLALLVLALPVFIVAGLPMAGYWALAAAWLLQRAVQLGAERYAAQALRSGARTPALGALAGTILVRLWIVTLAILLVGLVGEREAGLAAAVLAVVLVTASLGGQAVTHLVASSHER
jgi:hypothetical protein